MGILEEILAKQERLEALQEAQAQRIARLESQQDEWVSVKVAEKRTGKNRKTLLKEANRKGSLLLTKIENKRTRLYSAASIENYNNRKTLTRDPENPMRIAGGYQAKAA